MKRLCPWGDGLEEIVMQNILNDPVALGLAILGLVLFAGSYAIEWQRAWYEEYEKKKQLSRTGNSKKSLE